jgi:hypothetical protein
LQERERPSTCTPIVTPLYVFVEELLVVEELTGVAPWLKDAVATTVFPLRPSGSVAGALVKTKVPVRV